MRPLSQIEIRNVDQSAIEHYGIPGVVLMENAGRGCSQVVQKNWTTGSVVICCGKGNNGGDGFVLARYLENSGWAVKVRLATMPESVTGDAAVFLSAVQRSGIDVRTVLTGSASTTWGESEIPWAEFARELSGADLVVDALLGTGLMGAVRSPYSEIIEAINAAGQPVLAIDLPSGIDCNTGRPFGGAIRATRTATLAAPKLGFENVAIQAYTGPIEVVDIGLPLALVRSLETKSPS